MPKDKRTYDWRHINPRIEQLAVRESCRTPVRLRIRTGQPAQSRAEVSVKRFQLAAVAPPRRTD
jgi:hypothetical protein